MGTLLGGAAAIYRPTLGAHHLSSKVCFFLCGDASQQKVPSPYVLIFQPPLSVWYQHSFLFVRKARRPEVDVCDVGVASGASTAREEAHTGEGDGDGGK